MKRIVLGILAALGALVLCALAWLVGQLNHPPSLAPYAAQWLSATEPRQGRLNVRFLGVSTLLFYDDDTAILTDGFFSRPGKMQVLFGKIGPNPDIIAQSLERAGITKLPLAAVLVGHSHYDHVMDAPEVARRTGALLVGSPSTRQVGRGWGLADERMRVVADGESMQFGRFHITFIRSQHVPSLLTGGEICAPLVPPVRANAYYEGDSYSLLIRHGDRSMLVHGSAGYVDGMLRGHRADVVFLGIGMLGKQSDCYHDAFWRETVETVQARRVIAIHWDDFSVPLTQPLQALPPLLDDFDRSMAFLNKRGVATRVDLNLPPVWAVFDPWQGLAAPRAK